MGGGGEGGRERGGGERARVVTGGTHCLRGLCYLLSFFSAAYCLLVVFFRKWQIFDESSPFAYAGNAEKVNAFRFLLPKKGNFRFSLEPACSPYRFFLYFSVCLSRSGFYWCFLFPFSFSFVCRAKVRFCFASFFVPFVAFVSGFGFVFCFVPFRLFCSVSFVLFRFVPH